MVIADVPSSSVQTEVYRDTQASTDLISLVATNAYVIWAVSHKKVPYGRAHPSFGMTPTFLRTLETFSRKHMGDYNLNLYHVAA